MRAVLDTINQPGQRIDKRRELRVEEAQDMPETGVFTRVQSQIANLLDGEAVTLTAGHLELGPDLWLSADPAGRAVMSCQPSGDGFILRLEEGDSGAWACLGMRLPVETLKQTRYKQARYLGLLTVLRNGDVVSFTPTLRYYHAEGVQDVPTALPVILAGGPREHLSHIRLDPDQLAKASGCELNLFFHTNSFVAEFSGIEPLLII